MYQNLIALREKHGDYISFLKNNLLLSTNPNFYISPNYINDYRDDDGLID
jgi:hypothetical protein